MEAFWVSSTWAILLVRNVSATDAPSVRSIAHAHALAASDVAIEVFVEEVSEPNDRPTSAVDADELDV